MPSRGKRTRTKRNLTPKKEAEFRKILEQMAKQVKQLELQIRDLNEIAKLDFRIY
jgi:hypothetical protein